MNEQETIQKLRIEIRTLRGYVFLMGGLLVVISLSGFMQIASKQHFDEIDVERLNIVQADGKYCFVLTNGVRAPGAVIGGKEIRRSNSNNAPAIIFYNEEGDESGALVTAGQKRPDGTYYAASRLMFDRFQRDEMLSLQYYEDNGGGYAGLLLQDTREVTQTDFIEGNDSIRAMPDGPAKAEALLKFQEAANKVGASRLFIGKSRNKEMVVNLRDHRGQSRLRLQGDSLGVPRMDFLDENGNITCTLPDAVQVR